MNNYSVDGPVHIHGAEIDLVATPKGDPFAARVYIEATIEHVDNEKYGKDVGKLALIGERDRDARRLIVSSRGFSLPVRERALASRIDTLTYEELFAKFERFEPYLRLALDDDGLSEILAQLDEVYEEPFFVDSYGRDQATDWLTAWYRHDGESRHPWLVVVGEYGTGKTALTRVLLRRWLMAHRSDPSAPVPFRIELRDFTRQFDANGLLHHFLDHNGLGHIPIDFVWSLIRSGRVVLLLDGYDEMAQYLSARERRVCLEALAALSSGGARGILTSRPNYFSEAEEFHLFDVLYRDLEGRSSFTLPSIAALKEEESALDELIEAQFLRRHERSLQDLSAQQTEDLVRRILASDAEGASVVIEILRRVFRSDEGGAERSLSGKPVIITYLLDVVEQLKSLPDGTAPKTLTEWDVYTLVVDQLMLRDLKQAGRVQPARRRKFLHAFAVWLSQKDNATASEDQFRDLIQREFRQDLRRYESSQRQVELENLFEDLRRSGTLSRSVEPSRSGWRFSHNSLREFLLTEKMLESLSRGVSLGAGDVPITDAMRAFVRSQGVDQLKGYAADLARSWASRQDNRWVGQFLVLMWDSLLELAKEAEHPSREVMSMLSSGVPQLDNVSLSRIALSEVRRPVPLSDVNFHRSELTDVSLAAAELVRANFTECILESVDLSDANLERAVFRDSVLVDLNLARSIVTGADFRGVDADLSIFVEAVDSGVMPARLTGRAAIGYLRYAGALTDEIDSYWVLRHHPNFAIVEKVCARFSEHSPRQRLGVEQKGVSARNVPFARRFVAHLETWGFVEVRSGRADVLYVTQKGRAAVTQVATSSGLPPEIEKFLVAEA